LDHTEYGQVLVISVAPLLSPRHVAKLDCYERNCLGHVYNIINIFNSSLCWFYYFTSPR